MGPEKQATLWGYGGNTEVEFIKESKQTKQERERLKLRQTYMFQCIYTYKCICVYTEREILSEYLLSFWERSLRFAKSVLKRELIVF